MDKLILDTPIRLLCVDGDNTLGLLQTGRGYLLTHFEFWGDSAFFHLVGVEGGWSPTRFKQVS
jgi:hypothetical protein